MSYLQKEQIEEYLRDIRHIPVVTPEREKQLKSMIVSGDLNESQKQEIYDEMVLGNLRFVINQAQKFNGHGVSVDDLIAEGNYGLIKAIKKFDWTSETRFLTYAVWWIRQSIMEHLNNHSRNIRLPVNVIQEMSKMKKEPLTDDWYKEDNRYHDVPTTVTIDKVFNNDEETGTLKDILINKDVPSPEDFEDSESILKYKLNTVLQELDDREKFVVKAYHGMLGHQMTLQQIGDEIGLTKERVRQIKDKSLRKLRNSSIDLLIYLGESK